MIWGMCLLYLAGSLSVVSASPIRKTSKMDGKAAPQEEVNILMYGVIQLSESLNHVYETTGAKMEKIQQILKSREGTLQKLGTEAEQAAEVEKQIKEVIQLLQVQMATQQAQTQMTKTTLNNIEKDDMQLKTKVKELEMHINNFLSIDINELKERAEEHSSVLQSLQLFTQFQNQIIETENEQLSKLQQMSEAMA
ncbi:uncharacterized protein angptl8 [Melanotaenia boesemani]|uniref:uncharacterized protein angptl8 n=1 Tax=Melanotaenia boesemani TaxID=1250792 RepID=UPI001C058C29|nr:uncharacterized protein angptl8 [Melanotaenia boesemani]